MSAKDDAIAMRMRGCSYSEIASKTGLSKSTLSYHLSKIPYLANAKTVERIGLARVRAAETKSKKKFETYKLAKREAEQEIGKLSNRDIAMLGIGLYIGEGSKTHDIVRMVNTDPRVLRLFVTWMKQLGVQQENFKLRVHAYPETDLVKAEAFWLHELAFPKYSLQKPCIDVRLGKVKRKSGLHQHGTAHVTIVANGDSRLGAKLARKIGAYMDKVLE